LKLVVNYHRVVGFVQVIRNAVLLEHFTERLEKSIPDQGVGGGDDDTNGGGVLVPQKNGFVNGPTGFPGTESTDEDGYSSLG
jgi:hypothetical protein